MKEKKNRDR